MRGDERDFGQEVADGLRTVMAAPPESDVLTADPPAPLGCYLVDANWITRGKADGIATLGTFHGEQAAVDAVLGQVMSRKGEKECRRMARAGHLIIRVKSVAPELLAAMVGEVKAGESAARADGPELLPAPAE